MLVDLIGGPGDGGQTVVVNDDMPDMIYMEDVFGYPTAYSLQGDGKYLFEGYIREDTNE